MTDTTAATGIPTAIKTRAAIEVRDVTKAYNSTEVLRSISLDIPAGAVTAILGASGSGKTTLLRLIAGFDTIDAGCIDIGGRSVDDARRTVRAQHRGIGYVPQDAALFPHLTVLANIGFGIRRRERADLPDLIELVGLTGYEHRYPHQLSGGQQQRVALARALAIKPEVVLLDEPFGSLDAALRDSVRGDVVRILGKANTTTVLVTHDQDEAISLAQHLVLIDAGQVTASGTPNALYQHPPTPEVATAIGLANIVTGQISGNLIRCALGTVPVCCAISDPDGDRHVLVRPEQITLTTTAQANSVVGNVGRIRYHGHDTLIDLLLHASGHTDQPIKLTARAPGRSPFEPGNPVHLTTIGSVHAFDPPRR